MIKDLYLAIADKLYADLPELRYMDFYSPDYFEGQEYPFDAPAIFFALEPLTWVVDGRQTQTASTGFKLHIVQHSAADTFITPDHRGPLGIAELDLVDRVTLALSGLSPLPASTPIRRTTLDLAYLSKGLRVFTVGFSFRMEDPLTDTQRRYTARTLPIKPTGSIT